MYIGAKKPQDTAGRQRNQIHRVFARVRAASAQQRGTRNEGQNVGRALCVVDEGKTRNRVGAYCTYTCT